ncbi:MAG: hypothetical protein M3N08_01975, partial [Pseudomonadota bacterium]|nr:hypothetical protein [Pseudomonadota bacterium]
VSHKYDADLDIGHLHLLKLLKLPYKKHSRFENVETDAKNFAKNSLISLILWLHRTGALEAILKTAVIPAFQKAVESDVAIQNGPGAKNGIKANFKRVALQMLPVLEKDPGVSLLQGMLLEKLRPMYREKTPEKTASGRDAAEINVYGCWIDGRSTFGATYADGVTHSLDWLKVREAVKDHLGLPDTVPTGNDLVLRHLRTYPGFHPKTLAKAKLFYEQKGLLSDDEIRWRSALPDLNTVPTVKILRTGDVNVVTPDGRPLVQAQMPDGDEITHPRHILHALGTLSVKTVQDLKDRMEVCPALKEMLDPEKKSPSYPDMPNREDWKRRPLYERSLGAV